MNRFGLYTPFIKAKEGDIKAVAWLREDLKQNLVPFLDIPQIAVDIKNKKPKYTVEEHLEKIVNRVVKYWGQNYLFFYDFYDFISDAPTEYSINKFYKLLSERSLSGIPVTGIDRTDNEVEAIKYIIEETGFDLGIRINVESQFSDVININEKINDLVKTLEIPYERIHLFIDFRSIQESAVEVIGKGAVHIIRSLKCVQDVKSLYVAGSGYPDNLSRVEKDSMEMIPRTEISVWKIILKNIDILPRVPLFSDYGIVYPYDLVCDKPLDIPAKIRYCLEEDWLIRKGHSRKKDPKQYFEMASDIKNSPFFISSSFSLGDNYIDRCSKMLIGPGGFKEWITVDTCHHITFVMQQIDAMIGKDISVQKMLSNSNIRIRALDQTDLLF